MVTVQMVERLLRAEWVCDSDVSAVSLLPDQYPHVEGVVNFSSAYDSDRSISLL